MWYFRADDLSQKCGQNVLRDPFTEFVENFTARSVIIDQNSQMGFPLTDATCDPIPQSFELQSGSGRRFGFHFGETAWQSGKQFA